MVVGGASVFHLGGPSSALVAETVEITASQDNTLFEHATGALSNGAGDHFFVGTTNTGEISRGLLAFDLDGSIPARSVIDAARVTLNMTRTIAGGTAIELRRVEASWGEGPSRSVLNGEGGGAVAQPGDATWVHRFFDTVDWSSPGGDFAGVSATATVGGLGSYTWDSTPEMVLDVQTWLDDPDSNFGWLVKSANESLSRTAKRFAAREHPTATFRPRLSIDFTPPAATGTMFRRGDANIDGVVDVSDVVAIAETLFVGAGPFGCVDAADSNDDSSIDISDAVAILLELFSVVPVPDPGATSCGADPTEDELDCAAYAAPCT